MGGFIKIMPCFDSHLLSFVYTPSGVALSSQPQKIMTRSQATHAVMWLTVFPKPCILSWYTSKEVGWGTWRFRILR